jgi:hypothetical protein
MGVVDEEAFNGGRGGRDERGGHVAVEEVELLGTGDTAPGKTERQRVARDGVRCALHRHQCLRVQLPPPIPVRHPSHPPQHCRRCASVGRRFF